MHIYKPLTILILPHDFRIYLKYTVSTPKNKTTSFYFSISHLHILFFLNFTAIKIRIEYG